MTDLVLKHFNDQWKREFPNWGIKIIQYLKYNCQNLIKILHIYHKTIINIRLRVLWCIHHAFLVLYTQTGLYVVCFSGAITKCDAPHPIDFTVQSTQSAAHGDFYWNPCFYIIHVTIISIIKPILDVGVTLNANTIPKLCLFLFSNTKCFKIYHTRFTSI